jgi:hypothetical protein
MSLSSASDRDDLSAVAQSQGWALRGNHSLGNFPLIASPLGASER